MNNIKQLEKKIIKVSGEEKVKAMNDLALTFNNSEPEKAEKYAKKALALAKKVNYKKGIARSNNIIGISYHRRGDYKKAMYAYLKALIIFNEVGDKHSIASSHNNIGAVYEIQGNYDQALRYYFEALRINEELKDKQNIAVSYNNIGIVYEKQLSYNKALENHFKAVKIREKIKDKKDLAVSYNNIGVIYEKQNSRELALEYLLKALKIKEEIGDKQSAAISYVNVGSIYNEQGFDDKAMEYFLKALKTFEDNSDKYGITISCNSLGKIQTKLKQYDLAFEFIQKSLMLAKEIGAKELEIEAVKALSELYEAQEDFKLALQQHKILSDLEKEIFNKQKSKQIAEMQTKYETTKKEKEAEIHRLKNVELRKQINERKKAENEIKKSREQLRKLTNYLHNVREIEMQKITIGLYENLSQNLAALMIELNSLKKDFKGKQEKEKVDSMHDLVDMTLRELQKESHEIRPSHLDLLGLIPTIEWFVKEFKKQTGLKCKVAFEPENIDLNNELSVSLFRILQDVLDNINKHAKAKEVTISIKMEDGYLKMKISDDGIGITDEQVNDSESFGLLNIKERVLEHKGKIKISGKPGKGTRVEISVPIRM